MTAEEKRENLKIMLSPDEISEGEGEVLLKLAESIILNRMYPFGIPDGASIPSRYDFLQIQVAIEIFSKKGAEGQTGHSENGISRTYESASVSPSLLREIVPVAVVIA